MRLTSELLAIAMIVGAMGCGSSDVVDTGLAPGQVRAINASTIPVTVAIDGRTVLSTLSVSGVSAPISLNVGTHTVAYTTTSGASLVSKTIAVESAQTVATFAYSPSASSLGVDVIADTGAIVPANKSKLRVSNLAATIGSDEIWRTQPDFQTPIHIQTPFPYQATSPYLQSDLGKWEVFVTPAGGGAKLATTGAIDIPAGERRTAVLMDSAGTLVFKVFE